MKFALFRTGASPVRVMSGAVDRIGLPSPTFSIESESGASEPAKPCVAPDHSAALGLVLTAILAAAGGRRIEAVGHRIVHGGENYTRPALIDPEMLAGLERLRAFAPEHMPAGIELIKAIAARFPSLPQIACFDTAFHRDLPDVARTLPIPRRFALAGIRRYGFHGLSYEFLLGELRRIGDPAAERGRVILAHLGNGCSMAAVRDGVCIDTSMAFTPAAGLMMGRRSGDLDPGVLTHLARTERMAFEQIDRMVNHESGLLGVSEISSDVRELLAHEATDPRAAEALDLFCYIAKKWIGGFAAALGGLDALVFSGGIGENAPVVRERICAGLGFLGIALDPAGNAANAPLISKENGPTRVRVIPTDEELMIARSVCRVLDTTEATQGTA